MRTYEVYFRVPGIGGTVAEQVSAMSSDAAKALILARYPKATIDRVVLVR